MVEALMKRDQIHLLVSEFLSCGSHLNHNKYYNNSTFVSQLIEMLLGRFSISHHL